MCGIAGIYNLNGKLVAAEQIHKMTAALAHRGPDADGHFVEGPVALGHRRLSIIDLSAAANQPFSSHDGKYKMVFNGELYNFQKVRNEIRDHHFVSSGDTEVLMEGWARWGIGAVQKLKGMFSFAIWDRFDDELFIFRDRLGVKPLYYHVDDNQLLFASEIRSLLATGKIKRKVSPAALTSYLSYQSVNGQQSIIEGVKELKAGHFIHVKHGNVEIKEYWNIFSPGDVQYDGEPNEQVRKKIHSLLQQSVSERLISDVPIGAFLSGGIDSSAVVALMANASPAKPNTFNVSFQESDFDESYFAELVAKKYNTNHHRILLKPESLLDSLLPALSSMDTPSGDGINSYTVSKAIRESGITVALSGIGGDELFAGYPFFNQYSTIRKFRNLWKIAMPVREIAASFLGGSSKKERLRQLLKAQNCEIGDFYPIFRQILPPSYIERLTTLGHPNGSLLNWNGSIRDQIELIPQLSQVSVAEYLGYTQHTLLKDTDQMSMAVSLEVREPFFDHELVQYVLQLPDNVKFPDYPKKLLVESLGDLLPGEIVHRKKQGFVFPWAHWMRKDLKQFVSDKINAICDRPFVRPEALRQEWLKFEKGDESVSWMMIWLFVILEYWLEKNEIE